MFINNNTDSRHLKTLSITDSGSAYVWHQIAFTIGNNDLDDNLRINVLKSTATANTIYVDEAVIFPVANGKNFPHDYKQFAYKLNKIQRMVEEC